MKSALFALLAACLLAVASAGCYSGYGYGYASPFPPYQPPAYFYQTGPSVRVYAAPRPMGYTSHYTGSYVYHSYSYAPRYGGYMHYPSHPYYGGAHYSHPVGGFHGGHGHSHFNGHGHSGGHGHGHGH
jgi:hypothetical protein